MFEKEAEEYADNQIGCGDGYYEWTDVTQAYQKGAEFGYNKANEWHYPSKGEYPKEELEEKQLLVRVRNYTEDCIFAYYMLDKYYSKNGKRFYSDTDCDYPIDIKDIIAWKEIVLPELPKEIKEND